VLRTDANGRRWGNLGNAYRDAARGKSARNLLRGAARMIDVDGIPSKCARGIDVLLQVIRKQDVSRLESRGGLERTVNISVRLVHAEEM